MFAGDRTRTIFGLVKSVPVISPRNIFAGHRSRTVFEFGDVIPLISPHTLSRGSKQESFLVWELCSYNVLT
jgi:hypothetical protein